MIQNQWYVVLGSDEVKAHPVGVTRLGEKMVFWRDQAGKVHAAVDHCPQRGVALSVGSIEDGNLQCPFHGFEFDASGKCVLIPANGRDGVIPNAMRLNIYPTYEAYGLIWLWWGQPTPPELPMPEFFDNLDDSYFFGSARDPWDAHYSWVIENQLDVVHLPFIHRNTIGRGNRTVVDGQWWNGRAIRCSTPMCSTVWTMETHPVNRVNFRPKTLPAFTWNLLFPNLWQNYISENVRIFAAFVPVDEEHTLLYLRFYQNFMRLPVLGKLVARSAMPSFVYKAHQDRRVVVTQQPKASGLKIGEILIQGGLPVIEYRRKRAALQSLAE